MAIRPVDSSSGLDAVRAATTASTVPSNLHRSGTGAPDTNQAVVKIPATPPTPAETPQETAAQMRFHVDQDTGMTVVALVDPDNGQVLRQVPTEEALEVAKAIGKYQGMFVNLKV